MVKKTVKKKMPGTSGKQLSPTEFNVLNEKLDLLIQRVAMGSELTELKKEVREMEKKWEERFKLILEAMDKQTKTLTDHHMEHNNADMQIARLEGWVKEIATQTGVKLHY